MFRPGCGEEVFMTSLFSGSIRREHILMLLNGVFGLGGGVGNEVMDRGLNTSGN